MAGSDNFAPVAMSGSRDMPPSMVAETSSGMSERLTLDHPSFERLLAAAWVLQCLHDQLHAQEASRDETAGELVKSPEPLQTGIVGLPEAVQMVAQPLPEVTRAESTGNVPGGPPTADNILAEQVVQDSAETRTPSIPPPVKIEVKAAQPGKSFHWPDATTVHANRLPSPVLETRANDDEKERARLRPGFDLRIANLRAAFSHALDAFPNLRPAFRVSLTLPALRAVAIATPILLLAIVAASLLLETWRHETFQSAQAISRPSAPLAEAAVNEPSTTPTTKTRSTSDNHKRITNGKRNRASAIPPPRSSHRQVSDPTTLSMVQGLSRYEISGLRRRAKYGDASAAFTLGMAYEVGRHVPQNCAEATRWVTTAAEEGDAAAQYNLGLRYRDGDGVPANRAESEKWLRRAAARRYPKANLALKMLASR
jgi:TPR repeat protein